MPGKRTSYEVGSEEYYKGSKITYPNQFFDISGSYLPRNIKTLFKYCRSFFYTNGFIRNIITKLTEYPLTDILFPDNLDKSTLEKYKVALKRKLNIKKLMIEVGLDYYTFGNCFVSANLDFKRFLTCNSCKESFLIENHQDKWRFRDFSFHGTCPNCLAENRPFKIEDRYIKNIDSLNFVRWAPEQIDIDHDELTGKSTYYYKLSADRRKKILSGNKKTVMTTPKLFLEALKHKKLIELDKKNLFHFKRPTLAEENQAWGKPAILPAMKDIYYMQTLRRGNEAVAHEHVVPKKAIFPSGGGAIDPFQSINLGQWRGQMEEQILKWKKDPNHIGVFPIPIGYQQFGGDAKLLLLTPELRFLEENLIINMGLPLDFVRGGATWTGSSISLRIVENHFLPYREMLEDFLNFFVIQTLHDLLSYPIIKLKLKELKMTDDSESKQIFINMRETRQISQKTLLDKMGLSYAEEMENLQKEEADRLALAKKENLTMAQAQGVAQEALARAEARAQHAMQDEAHRLREEPFEKNILEENKNLFMDSSSLIEMLALQLNMVPPEEQDRVFNELVKRAPVTGALVLERFMADQQNKMMMQEEPPGTEDLLPQPGPGAPEKGNKKENQPQPKGNKSKGAARGNPAS